ncbi:hypothetical protein [Paenibacillus sp. DMB20]|uniref:hypothetical protein n=1 Tax=Paenibacillus sp. DMB20 TaxID=1642570 RepID=UPI000627A665|nr:hypothetical protein [Paenibacillus sp. DMB20]KKO54262.1 nucleoside-diphosphate sugar epimerase [Paenibacillus sp. DMB20]
MENKINDMVEHLSHSQQQMARIFEAQRHAAVRMSEIIHSLPDHQPEPPTISSLPNPKLQFPDEPKSQGGQVEQVNESIAAYLNAMADMQQMVADIFEVAMKELRANEQAEE